MISHRSPNPDMVADEPIFHTPLAHPRVFIPQEKMLELCKYLFVVPEDVEFIIENVFGVNDFKLDHNPKTPIYIQDIKLDVYEGKGIPLRLASFTCFLAWKTTIHGRQL